MLKKAIQCIKSQSSYLHIIILDMLGLMNNYHKTERQSWIIQEMTHSIKIQGYVNFWMWSFL